MSSAEILIKAGCVCGGASGEGVRDSKSAHIWISFKHCMLLIQGPATINMALFYIHVYIWLQESL